MKLRSILIALIFSLILAACNFPAIRTPTSDVVEPTSTPGVAPLGTETNPIVMAIRPGATPEAAESAARLAGELSRLVGVVVVARETKSYNAIVDGLGAGEIHMAWLPPLAYLLAHDNGDADVALAIVTEGRERAGFQFMVSAARISGVSGFRTYFDPASGENLVDASAALAQFADKRPCWTDAYAPAGYVLPQEILNANEIATRQGAFLQGEDTVVRTLYRDTRGDLCDFGVTSVDARTLLAAELPDVMDKVAVVWRGAAAIPNDSLAYAPALADDVRIHLTAAFLAIAASEEGMNDLRVAYGVDDLKMIDDTFFNELRGFLSFPFSELRKYIR